MSDKGQLVADSSYLRYLPGVLAKSGDGFLARYLRIFEKLLSGLDDQTLDGRRGIQELLAAGVVGNLFYSRFSFLFPKSDHDFIPPISGLPTAEQDAILALFDSYIGVPARSDPLAGYVASPLAGGGGWQADFMAWLNEFLDWLASWVNLVLDHGWTLDKKRLVIAEIMALYRLRGTAQGMSMLLNLVLDLPLSVHCYTPPRSPPVMGPLSINVLNPTPPSIMVNKDAGTANTFTLNCAYLPGAPLVSGYAPWLFLLQVVLPAYGDAQKILDTAGAQQVQTLLAQLTTLVEAVKPAASRYQLQILGGMCLLPDPYRPQLNLNAVLGTKTPTL
ncbi:phage tail protein [Dyella tabacisoli]|uniref:Uncharacterized protein n=1 Tax=Dyella tabacisoli TaxID=2282381 RepID=A0A369UMQ2_9GAMM|nr:phage tail protein [Dyella tabacisoli]RDD81355.1 hypothetical protein DVJ77_13800 [Dyella tabacisoli]